MDYLYPAVFVPQINKSKHWLLTEQKNCIIFCIWRKCMQTFAQAFNESEITNYSCWGTFQTFPCNECWIPPPGWRPRWSSSLTRARSPSRTSPRSPPPRSRASWSRCWGSLRQSQTLRGRLTSRRGPKWIRRVQLRKWLRREWRQLRSVHLRKHLACNLINMNGLSATRQP